MIRLAIVDDDPMVRTGLSFVLAEQRDMTICWQASNGAEALTLLASDPVDVMLLDIRMPVLDGLATLDRLKELGEPPRVIALTTFNTDDYVLRALRSGAAGFLLKDTDPDQLFDAIRCVHAGQTRLSQDVIRQVISVAVDTKAPTSIIAARRAYAELTPREQEVSRLLACGLTNSQIASRLHISLGSVKTHLTAIFIKLNVDNRVSAAMVVKDAGEMPDTGENPGL